MSNIIRMDLGGVNSYLIETEQGFILVDTGGHLVMDKQFTNRCELLQKKLDMEGCTGDNLKLIVLTHGDNDHSCNALYFKTHYNAPIAMHNNDRKLVENPTLEELIKSFEYHSLMLRIAFRVLKKTIQKVMQKTLDEFSPFTPDLILNDGFDLSPYGLDATIIHTPGHTSGSTSILTKDGNLIAGDTFSNNKKPEIAANAVDFIQLSESAKKLKKFSIKMVYPGHGTPFSFDKI